MPNRRTLALVLGGALAFTLGSALAPKGAAAQDPKAGEKLDIPGLQAKLRGGQAAEAQAALEAAQAAGPRAAALAGAIEELARRGASESVTKAAMEALEAIGAASSSAVLRPYLRHRAADLRRAAVRALASTKGPEAVLGFREGLRSGDGMVRGYSATGLGALGAREAMDDLFLALDRNVTEAAASIGQLCVAEECDRFAGKLGKVAFDVMTSGLDPIFFRAKALPEEALLKVTGQLRELGTPEAGKYLADVQSRWPATGSKKVKQAIDSAVSSIPGAR